MDTVNALVVIANFVAVPAIAYGSQLALGALGVTLVYAILRFSNFAHGDTMAFGCMIAVFLTIWMQSAGISIAPLPTALLAIPLAIAGTVGFALATDRLVYRYHRRRRVAPMILMILSFGVMLVTNGVVRLLIGPGERRFSDGERFIISARGFRELTGLEEGLAIRTTQCITVVAAIVLMWLLFRFLKRTRTGKAMRAYSDNEELALLSGIDPERVTMLCWIIAAALAAISGTLFGLDKIFKPFIYFQLLLPVFASAVVGGLGSPVGAVVGAYIVAFSEIGITYAFKRSLAHLLPEWLEPSGLAQILSTDYKFAVSFALLVCVLLIRPTGLFGQRQS